MLGRRGGVRVTRIRMKPWRMKREIKQRKRRLSDGHRAGRLDGSTNEERIVREDSRREVTSSPEEG